MINETILEIKQDKKLYSYLKYHSYWYYIITYDREKIKEMIKEMKIELKETTEDKIKKLNNNLELIQNFFNIIV